MRNTSLVSFFTHHLFSTFHALNQRNLFRVTFRFLFPNSKSHAKLFSRPSINILSHHLVVQSTHTPFILSSRNLSTNLTITPECHTNKLSYPYFNYFSNLLIKLTWLPLFLSCSNYQTYFTNQNLCTILFAITFDSYLYFSMTNPASSVKLDIVKGSLHTYHWPFTPL